jgi:hypothetical protein
MGIMHFIKFIIISIVILSLLVTGISLLFPSTVIASRAIEMKTDPQKITYFVADLNHWSLWMSDWKENKVVLENNTAHIGTQTVQFLSKTDHSVNYQWETSGQRPYLVQFEWTLLKDSSYVIHWSFEQKVKWYPWEKFQTLLNDKVLGAKMELGLQNLQMAINQKSMP